MVYGNARISQRPPVYLGQVGIDQLDLPRVRFDIVDVFDRVTQDLGQQPLRPAAQNQYPSRVGMLAQPEMCQRHEGVGIGE